MGRLDTERQEKLEPNRMRFAKNSLIMMGFHICYEDKTRLEFLYNGSVVKFYPYSGWHTGKSIKDGRGFRELIKQLKNN